ncbi:MAG: PEP-CTERM sorting domain-containing protein [Methylophilaceae bacterium]
MKTSIILAALASACFALTSQAAIVVNGGFEDTEQAAGTWTIYNAITGWTGLPNVEVRNNVVGTAHSGSNFVELDTDFNSAISQDLVTVAGQSYDLSFYYSPRLGVNSESNPIDVFLNDVLLGTANGDGTGNTDNVWQLFTFNFIGAEGTTTTNLRFSASGISDSLGGSLDDVSVTAVPESETYAMMLAGIGVMGAVARRKQKTEA